MIGARLVIGLAIGAAFGFATAARAGDAPFVCGEAVERTLAEAEAKASAADRAYRARPHLRNADYHNLAGLNPVWLWNYKKYERIRNLAGTLEKRYFGPGRDGDEGDAYRHFLGTLLLARKVGLAQAKWIPRIHDAGQFDIQAEMDKYNNARALAYARAHLAEIRKLDEWALGEYAFAALPASGVVVVRPKTTVYCGNIAPFAAWLAKELRR